MPTVEVEEVAKDSGTLSRSCIVSLNQRKVLTPTRTIGVTRTSRVELDAGKPLISKHFSPLGEVYSQVTLDSLSQIRNETDKGKKIIAGLSNRLEELAEAGVPGYLVLALVDDEGLPFNKVPPAKVLALLFDILWGTPKNNLIVPPLLGPLQDESAYLDLVKALRERQSARADRKDIPIAGLVPATYRLIGPQLAEHYWKLGCRFYVFNCENKKFGAIGYIVERLHLELGQLSRRAKEPYVLHALNAKLRTGRAESTRVNDLLSPGFGFDSYGSNHGGRQRWRPGPAPPPPSTHLLLDADTYGFRPITDVSIKGKGAFIPESRAFQEIRADEIHHFNTAQLRNLTMHHNIEKEISELSRFPDLIARNGLLKYLSAKDRVREEVSDIAKMSRNELQASRQKGLDEWFA